MIRILQPWFLVLLLFLPLLWYTARNIRVMGYGRKTLTVVLRTIVFVLLILALADLVYQNQGDRLSVFFVVDRSASVPLDEQEFSLNYVQQKLGELPQDDKAGIIFFGKDASIQDNPREDIQLTEYQPIIDTSGTDIESAIGLAMAAFPEDTQKRIVLLTDGNQTQGETEMAVQRALANDIDVRLLPLQYSYSQDALVEDIIIPQYIQEKEPFNVKVIVNAQEEGSGVLRLMENGEVVAEEAVDLKQGKNAFTIPRSNEQGGFYTFDAIIEAENDSRPSNNRSQNFTIVQGTPRVLLLETEPGEGQNLAAALVSEGIDVDYHTPEYLPGILHEFQLYDSIILSNVPASDISPTQQEMLELAVKDLGVGLVMIGGPDSFGAGGYLNTPVERALPVTMDVKQQRMIPSGALALIMHSMEIPQGNHWAREISLEALNVLSRNDYMGFLYFNSRGFKEDWLFDMAKVGTKTRMRNEIMNMPGNAIGDMPTFVPTMDMAFESLQKVNANKKHLVILSDGDPQRPTPAKLQAIRDAGITISTVCISPHSPQNADIMQAIAEVGGGNFYHVKDNTNLPKIFIKEASVIRKNLLIEETFDPVLTSFSDIIEGFGEGFPSLDGYVVTSQRPEAETIMVTHKQDPLLAQWRYGLGKSVIFTSDAKSRWAGQWISWANYAKFWSQMVRWTIRSGDEDQFQVMSTVEGDKIRVVIDAVTPDGGFMNQLNFTANAIDPNVQSSGFDVVQTQPGRYEGTFAANEAGSYVISMAYEGQDDVEGHLTSGVSVPFSPEHSTTQHSASMQKRIADLGGKPFLSVEENVFLHDLAAVGEMKHLWPLCLGLAIFFFFLDIAVRRLYFELTQVQKFFQRVWDTISSPFRSRTATLGPATDQIGALMQAKARVHQPSEKSTAQRESFAATLDQTTDEEIEESSVETVINKPAWNEVKPGEEAPSFEDTEENSYTSALFKAKQRAQQQKKK